MPCTKPNSYCEAISLTDYICKCNESFVPKDGDAECNGCIEKGYNEISNQTNFTLYATPRTQLHVMMSNDNFHKYPFSIVFTSIQHKQTDRDTYVKIHFQASGDFFADPCHPNPCNGTNSYCEKVSVSKYNCKCNGSFVPKEGDAESNGCIEKGNNYHAII